MYSIRHIVLCVRCFTTYNAKSNKYFAREGRMMQKIMKGSLKKRKNWYDAEKVGNFPATPGDSSFQKGSKDPKRVAVLNKLLMKNITDLMATGEVAGDILGRGISISKVKISPDYNMVNIYWLAKGTEEDEVVENVLSNSAYSLRHELTQLHIMGVMPKLQFVKDKQGAIVSEVDYLLSKADFGNDFEPRDSAAILRSEFTLSGDLQDQLHDVDDEESLPAMRMDVLGLDHAAIMQKICKSVKKSEAAHRSLPDVEEGPRETQDVEGKKSDITKFVQKQKFLKDKKRRQELKHWQNNELMALHSTEETEFVISDDEDEDDYIDEFEDKQITK